VDGGIRAWRRKSGREQRATAPAPIGVRINKKGWDKFHEAAVRGCLIVGRHPSSGESCRKIFLNADVTGVEKPLSERKFGSIRTVAVNYTNRVVKAAFARSLGQLGRQIAATTPRSQTGKSEAEARQNESRRFRSARAVAAAGSTARTAAASTARTAA
jgi:hypothetical protein